MSDPNPKMLVIGGAHVDRLAKLGGAHLPQTSNPVTMTEVVGGGGFNAGRAARRFNVDVSILSARGGDAAAQLVEDAIALAGIQDLSSVHLDRASPSYTAVLEPDGNLVTAIADMGLYETAIARSFKRAPVQKVAAQVDAVLCDANLVPIALHNIFNEVAKGKPVFGLAVSATKVTRFSSLLPHLTCLFMNRFEAAALTGLSQTTPGQMLAEDLLAKGLARAVISAGKEPATFYEGETVFQFSPPQVNVVDVTGAGDCLAGTMIAAMLGGHGFLKAAKLGLSAASLTAARQGPSPIISQNEIESLANLHVWKT
ncbi:MAG: PfkB family carbohydrate kinase [Notoacmeibacter sp.]